MKLFEFDSNLLYHGTTKQSAKHIRQYGFIGSINNPAFFTPNRLKAWKFGLLRTNEFYMDSDAFFNKDFRDNVKIALVTINYNDSLKELTVGNNKYFVSTVNLPTNLIIDISFMAYKNVREILIDEGLNS